MWRYSSLAPKTGKIRVLRVPPINGRKTKNAVRVWKKKDKNKTTSNSRRDRIDIPNCTIWEKILVRAHNSVGRIPNF